MRKKKRPGLATWMLLLLPAVFLAGLGLAYWGRSAWRDATFPPAEPVSFGRMELSIGKRVSLEGYLGLPDKDHPKRSNYLLLYDRHPHAPFDRYIIVYFKASRSDRPNTMQPLPEDFSSEDISLTANDGRPVQAGDRLRLTGWSAYKFLDCERISLDRVDTIELLP